MQSATPEPNIKPNTGACLIVKLKTSSSAAAAPQGGIVVAGGGNDAKSVSGAENAVLTGRRLPAADLAPLKTFSWAPGFNLQMGLSDEQSKLFRALSTGSFAGLPPEQGQQIKILLQQVVANFNVACKAADANHQAATKAQTRVTFLEESAKVFGAKQKAFQAEVVTNTSLLQEEIATLKAHKDKFMDVTKQIRELLICSKCCEVALLPKVLGTCGHIACQSCLNRMDDVAFSTLTQAGASASARQHLLARRCPLCRVEIIGQAFPVIALKGVASLLVENNLIEVSELTVQKSIVDKSLVFEKETPEMKYNTALKINCWAQYQLAQHSVDGVIKSVIREEWLNGVYILFEASVSRVFFETFATTLQGKAGGVDVLANTSQRMLAAQIIRGRHDRALDSTGGATKDEKAADSVTASATTDAKAADTPPQPTPKQHVLIKVSSDGRFIKTLTPAPSNAPTSDVKTAASVATTPAAPSAPANDEKATPVTETPSVSPATTTAPGTLFAASATPSASSTTPSQGQPNASPSSQEVPPKVAP